MVKVSTQVLNQQRMVAFYICELKIADDGFEPTRTKLNINIEHKLRHLETIRNQKNSHINL